MEPRIPEAATLTRQLVQSLAQGRPLGAAGHVPARGATDADRGTGPSLAEPELLRERPHREPVRRGR
jgi:hypothetical protein